jgi:superfamily II DNA/RNA helicase
MNDVVNNTENTSPELAAPAVENGFAAFGLAQPLLRAIESLGFTQPTPVQRESIPAAMKGGDWMVSAQTGSGKTAAFLLPTINILLSEANTKLNTFLGPRILVLCPTRELAAQVAADAINIVRHARGVRIATVVGGMPFGKQIAALKGASVVIATPGRLLDLANRRQIRLDHVASLIVDEADRMLDLGFSEDLEAIHKLCEARSQTLMFSATFAPRIMQLAARLMNEPGRLELASAGDKHADIAQTLHWVDGFSHKRKLLDHWLRDTTIDQAIVFTSTQADADTLAGELEAEGHSAAALHGAMPQAVRNRRLKSLRDGRIRVLVATDVAARGIDVPTISHVINFGLPMKAEDYVHRIGRTGRAGRSGVAVTLAEYRDRPKVMAIERYTQQRFNPSVIAGLEPQPPKRREPRDGAPRRSFGDAPRSFGDAPRRDFADRPRRDFGDAPRRPFNDSQAPRRFEDRAPRSFDDAAPRSFGDAPRRPFNPDAPRRSFGDAPARPFSDAPRREFSDRPRRDFADAPRRSFSDAPRPAGDSRPVDSRPRFNAGSGDSRPAARPAADSRPAPRRDGERSNFSRARRDER